MTRGPWTRGFSGRNRWAWSSICLGFGMTDRVSYDAARNTLFINYEGFHVRSLAEVELVRREVEGTLPWRSASVWR